MKTLYQMRRCGCNNCRWNLETFVRLRKAKKGGGWFRNSKRVRKLFRERANPAPCIGVRPSLWSRIKAAARRLARKGRA